MSDNSKPNDFRKLAEAPHVHRPDVLLGAVAHSLMRDDPLSGDENKRLCRLAIDAFGEITPQLKKSFVKSIAKSRVLSRDLLSAILALESEIAAPVISRSPLFTTSDFIKIAKTGPAGHLRALSVRDDLSDEALLLLAELGNEETALIIGEKRRIEIKPEIESILWERACRETPLARVLVGYRQRHVELALPFFHRLPFSVRRDVLTRLAQSEAKINVEQAETMVRSLADKELLAVFEKQTMMRDYRGLADTISAALEIDRQFANDAVHDPSGELAVIVSKSLGCPDETLVRQLILGPMASRYTRNSIAELVELHRSLPLRVAHAVVACWRIQAAPHHHLPESRERRGGIAVAEPRAVTGADGVAAPNGEKMSELAVNE